MDYGSAFTYLPNTSKNWISKVAMGVVFTLLIPFLGIGGIALLGWSIAIARRVLRGEVDVLPEWSELVPIFIDGLKAVVVLFVWYLPFWILSGINALVDNAAVNILVSCCSLIYGIPFSILALGIPSQLAGDRTFGEILNPVNAWHVISANWANTIITWLVVGLTMVLGALVGTVLCGIGILVGIPYAASVAGHLYGQLYGQAQGKAAAA